MLLKEITVKDGKKRLYPHKVYCYRSVIETLKTLVKKSNFTERCELWRQREIRSMHHVMCDVFEGRVWRDFQVYNGSPFLEKPRNYGFMLNVDWMQPFTHTQYSIGVLYMVLMNVPREERFKRENVIFVGIIPGPREPSGNINAYLSPLVDELELLWNDGILLKHSGSRLFPERFRAALLCVACDIPAARKTCGFTSHNSKNGCHRCTKQFKTGGIGEPTDYSGFDPCVLRTDANHHRQVEEICQQTTQDERNAMESNFGSRYSELLRLPYFDCVHFTIVDPMHNLFLGTAKHMVEIWIGEQILKSTDLTTIQERVDQTETPSDIGRLPTKIGKSFGGFTAEQWKTWVIVFSAFALYGQLPVVHYNCWLLFVEACAILCKPTTRILDVGKAHSFLLQFCREFERLYGPGRVTPNMHLHTHLADCTLDYGPVYSFWLFSFERYNGTLGAYHTNNKSVEIQMMRMFLRDQNTCDIEFPESYREQFEPLLSALQTEIITSAAATTMHGHLLGTIQLSEDLVNTQNPLWYSVECFQFGTRHVVASFDEDDLRIIADTYRTFFPTLSTEDIPRLFDKYASMHLAGNNFGSNMSRLSRSSYILARWPARYDGEIDITGSDLRPGVVKYFAKQSITFNNSTCTFCFARVAWFQRRGRQHKVIEKSRSQY